MAATVGKFPVVLLQCIIDYLLDDKKLIDTIVKSVDLSIGGRSSQRIRTICADPDAEIAAILRTREGLSYQGCRLERFLGLLPLGTALVAVVVKYFQPARNVEVRDMVASLGDISFMDSSQRLSVTAAYMAISQLIAKVSRSGMSFNVAIVYEHIAKAMAASSDSARDNGQWKQLCLDVMRTFRTLPGNSAMSREILDDTMTAIRKVMDKEAEEQGLESTFRSALSTTRVSAISEGDVHLISEDADGSRTGSADGSRTGSSELSSSRTGSRLMENTWEQGPGDDGEEDDTGDFYVQYVNRQNTARNCTCGAAMRWGTDYCGACKSFRPNTQICTSCGAPRVFSDTATEHCRN